MLDEHVRVWQESVVIPTYGVGQPDPNPMFLERRVYQGSSGAVYPWPVVDRIENECSDREWQAVFLENQYLKIMILPELGGRVQMAVDKTNDYHFVYYNRVIKPALVGLAGPWISGGIEFNWPQHHRPNTFSPLDHEIVENPDGSCTVWCNDLDRIHRTRGMHGLTLHPDKAYLEVKVRLSNRTDQPQSFLWWANPAVHVDENHQSIFPTDVHAVMDHGKRDVSEFPIARGTYYKVDYSPGTDISRYRNIPVPTSYMVARSDYDFVGSYDHGRRAGLLHVCDHHISPGKKQWTWGNGDFGRAWDQQLTDDDGPYIELMCGVYTDNQPDFSWLMPGETKSFSQFFMPYKGVGVVKNATVEASVGLDVDDHRATIRVYTTSDFPSACITIQGRDGTIFEQTFDATPQGFQEVSCEIDPSVDRNSLRVGVTDSAGRELVSWQAQEADHKDIPSPAKAIDLPEQLDSVESLYLAGIHLEQYRHATREPGDYYREGLRRDPGDIRCNNAVGKLLYRRGRFADAERHHRKAIERLTRHNPNPLCGEAYYDLGLSLVMQERFDEAADMFHKATWNAAQQEAAYFQLARIACRRQNWAEALTLVDECLARNVTHVQGTHLKILLLDQLDRPNQACTLAEQQLQRDPFNAGVLFEKARIEDDFETFRRRLRDDEHNYIELAIDYARAGLYQRAVEVVEHYLGRVGNETASPMPHYHLADYYRRLELHAKAATQYALAESHDPRLCFPNRVEDICVLQAAADGDSIDGHSAYYLGNLWYDKRQYDLAIAYWEKSRDLAPSFPTVHRNLGLAYFNSRGDTLGAWSALQKAFELNPNDARVLFELDQLAKRLGHQPADRLKRLASYRDQVDLRDDLYLEFVTLLNTVGNVTQALDLLLAREFHPWEGGEGRVPAQFVLAITLLARKAVAENRFQEGLELLQRTEVWPRCLSEGKLAGIQENNIHYLMGLAHQGLGDTSAASRYFEKAADGLSEPSAAMFYNDHPPDMIFYQGLALRAMQRNEEARLRFEKMVEYGLQHLDDKTTIDYFAVSLPEFLVFEDDLNKRNEIHCRYVMALGLLGLEEFDRSKAEFNNVLSWDPSHQGARLNRDVVDARREIEV